MGKVPLSERERAKALWAHGARAGKLMLGDGGFYEGDFRQGEMTGFGVRQWADGSR
jgi:hypothetical protein